MIFPTQYRVPSYGRWLLHEADMAPAYRMAPAVPPAPAVRAPGRRWLLKSPGHLWCLARCWPSIPTPSSCRPTATRSSHRVRGRPRRPLRAIASDDPFASPSARRSTPTTSSWASTGRWRPGTTAPSARRGRRRAVRRLHGRPTRDDRCRVRPPRARAQRRRRGPHARLPGRASRAKRWGSATPGPTRASTPARCASGHARTRNTSACRPNRSGDPRRRGVVDVAE